MVFTTRGHTLLQRQMSRSPLEVTWGSRRALAHECWQRFQTHLSRMSNTAAPWTAGWLGIARQPWQRWVEWVRRSRICCQHGQYPVDYCSPGHACPTKGAVHDGDEDLQMCKVVRCSSCEHFQCPLCYILLSASRL